MMSNPPLEKITLNNSQEFLGLSESEWDQLIALNHAVLFVMSQLAKKGRVTVGDVVSQVKG